VPEWKQEIRQRLQSSRLDPARESAIVEELGAHLDDYYAELLAGGATEAEAERQTLAELSASEIFESELLRVERRVAPEPIARVQHGTVPIRQARKLVQSTAGEHPQARRSALVC